ncbi:hypothetical protein UFOVP1439_30 [uncultured Caudovirales phage]|jgi:DNA-directed RNA polymerase specialized sigma24 family protein|uniref:Uncharacterized protein n=1 Tax=uncultured Caudovirales phage TaxID=2100421 RepID=A0A6J5QM63_9CAUD|nr:hypothetical protein UFOVP1085_10 [uncultured Caudovirales phage]CAB4212655.1 hypothetical protein UFOVP1439_30 [uncultured Caudovirales phage]
MDQLEQLIASQLTEKEVILILLVESGMTHREIGDRLMVHYSSIHRAYKKGKAKMDRLAEAGIFSTPVKKVQQNSK